MTITYRNVPSIIHSTCFNNQKFVFLRKMHTDLRVTHWKQREIIKSTFILFLKDRGGKILKCMLNVKRFSQEIKNMLGISNRGNLKEGIVIKMLEGLDKQK